MTARQQGGDSGGAGTSGAVGIATVDALCWQAIQGLSVQQQINGFAVEVAAFEQHVARPEFLQASPGPLHVSFVMDRQARQFGRFRKIWGEQIGLGQQLLAAGFDGLFLQQRSAAFGDHHRVDYRQQAVLF